MDGHSPLPNTGLVEPLVAASAFLGVEWSASGRRWRLRESANGAAHIISERYGLREIVGRLLAQRGIGVEQAPAFLAPRLRDQLPDPTHLLDMVAAVERLVRAVRDREKIVVFGDYDVDGATSAALLLRFFAAIGVEAGGYFPPPLPQRPHPHPPPLFQLN